MDSGLGSDDDRRGRTKEQKQLRNQQLLSGCFIDASSLAEDPGEPPRSDERRQGALVFQAAIPQFSMLQMGAAAEPTSTPYNSIVHLEEEARKSPLGFYVDLSAVEAPQTPPASAAAKKNIFSMVIDFEGPKKDKPIKLSSSLVSFKKSKQTKQLVLTGRPNGSLSSSMSSVGSVAGPSRQVEDSDLTQDKDDENNHLSMSSKSSTSSENMAQELGVVEPPKEEPAQDGADVKESSAQDKPQFVKLSDLECQKPRLDLNFTPRMSKSIPESSWVESPLLMSRSAGYRSAPHPLEPEAGDVSDSDSVISDTASQPRRSVRRLGTDLLRMFLEEIGPDVVVEVEGRRLNAHKCILASRCQYFAAMLSGDWLEASGNVISLQGFSHESVYFALCHIYSGAAHVPDSINLVELASLADMLGLEGLKEVVEHALKHRHCHNFHKPCAGCCTGVLEVLHLSATYGLDDLYLKCLQWTTQHFVRVWPSRAFAGLSRELREKCYQRHVVHLSPDKVLDTIASCDKVLATLPALRWAEPVSQLVLQLADECHLYLRQHFAAVLGSRALIALNAGLGWGVAQVEEHMMAAAKGLGVEQACRSYTKCSKMVEQDWSRPFADLLYKIKVQLEQCLVAQGDRLVRSNAWLRLDSVLRCRIKDLIPANEPVSRLPRATPKRSKNAPPQSAKGYTPSPTLSSSDSSRNSSPGVNQATGRIAGSPSLRRSLLLAARAPQMPPSPSTHRRSTLTQPTHSSAAKMTPSKNLKATPAKNPPKPASAKLTPSMQKKVIAPARNAISQPNLRKSNAASVTLARKPTSRSSSPLKVDSRASSPRKFDARVTSPMKVEVARVPSPKVAARRGEVARTPSVRKAEVERSPSAKKVEVERSPSQVVANKAEVKEVEAPRTIQRSSTFLKDEPTIIGKVL